MNVKELSEKFNLHVVAGGKHLDRQIQGGYCGDLLSDVMANAPNGCIWLTVQTHQNIVAVAVLHEMAAIVLTGGQEPDQETVDKAQEEGIPILISSTKLQINFNFQYTMTKTFSAVVPHRLANPGLPVMMPLGTTVDGSFVLNFEFGSLGFV